MGPWPADLTTTDDRFRTLDGREKARSSAERKNEDRRRYRTLRADAECMKKYLETS